MQRKIKLLIHFHKNLSTFAGSNVYIFPESLMGSTTHFPPQHKIYTPMFNSMTKKLALALAGIALIASTGCVQGPRTAFKPNAIDGILMSEYSAPLSTDFKHTDVSTLKKGTAKASNILGLVSTGDCSITAAVKEGGLTTVEYADYKYHCILGIFSTTEVSVYGK